MEDHLVFQNGLPGGSEHHLDSADKWLTVAEAVSYCAHNNLPRTAKTVRKWAHRSHQDPENGDVVVRQEDVENGFRWMVERTSLLRKIEQELEFEARRSDLNNVNPAQTGSDASEQVRTGAVNESQPIQLETLEKPIETGLNPSAPVQTDSAGGTLENSEDNPSESTRTGAYPSEPGTSESAIFEQLQARIDDLKSEVEFYRDELKDRRHTTLALTDVIEAFD